MNGWMKGGAAMVVMSALLFATGCPGFFVYPGSLTGGSSSTGDYVYVANGTAETLTAFSVGTGTLTEIGSPFSLGFVPTSLVVNPANTIVFVAGSSGIFGFINAYAIGSGGALSLLTSNNVGSAEEVAMDVSPDGDWLLGLDSNGASLGEAVVDNYEINTSTGQLTLATGAIYTVTGSPAPAIVPRAIKFAPNEDYIFVALGTAGDLVFPFAGGTLSAPLPLTFSSSAGVSDNALAVNGNSSYLYIARSGTTGGLAVFAIGSGGSLSQVGSTQTAGSQPISVVLNRAGTDIYLANQLSDTISGYSIASNEAVSALSPATDATPSAPYALAVDNSGNYVLAASEAGSPDLSMFSYDSTTAGKLDLVTETATGTDPTGPIAIAATH